MVEQFPDVRRGLEQIAARAPASQSAAHDRMVRSVPLERFLAQGLMEAQSLLVLDLEKCTRCDNCVRACADAHDGVTRLVREGLRFDKYLVATSCRQCRDPLCMVGCPVGSIRRRNSLEVIIEDWCIGCGLCAKNCPYGNINLHPFTVRSGRSRGARPQSARWCGRKPLPAICAPTTPSRVASTPARTTPRIAWTHANTSRRFWAKALRWAPKNDPTSEFDKHDAAARAACRCELTRRTSRGCGLRRRFWLPRLCSMRSFARRPRSARRAARRSGLAFGVVGFAFMIFAGLLGARKKVPVWRVGRAQTWMRGHLWLGLLALPLILFHGGFHFGGALTSVLMVLLIITVASGLFGAALQHYLPAVMTREVPWKQSTNRLKACARNC